MDVSRETRERLQIYMALLIRWNPKINLVAPATLADAENRHFDDSLQLLEHISPPGSWLDLGSGGGFPGAVVAIVLGAQTATTLIESDQRKAAFLRTVARETGVSFRVISRRIEDVPPQSADVISARALAPLPKLLSLAYPHLSATGTMLLQKGRKASEEIAAALEHWRFSCETYPSTTDPDAVILKLKDIQRA